MLKSFKLIATTLMSLSMGMAAFAQEQERFKDVLLDGKPAKLNVVTGEITLVTLEEKSVEGILDTVTVRPILVSDTSIITASNKSEVENESTSDFYIVKDGETLLDVSKKYKVTLAQLMEANNLEPL